MAKRLKKGEPFSMRLSPSLEVLVTEEARRTKRSRGAVVAELAEEAARSRLFPGIAFRDEPRRPWVIGTGLDVWQIIEAYQDFGSVEQMVAGSELSEAVIRLALAYYERFPEEIDEAIAENRRPLSELRELYPFIEVVEI